MTHCNDQLIDQLLTQAEQEGRCLIPPSTAIRKALLRRTGGTVVSPMPGLFARKTHWDELNRAQRHCEILRALAIIHPDWTFCSFSAACLLGLEVSWRHLNVVHFAARQSRRLVRAHIFSDTRLSRPEQYAEPAYR